VQLAVLRAESGFFDEAFLLALETAHLPYVVAALFTNPLQAAAYRLTFRAFAPVLEVAELPYQSLRWTQARRRVVVREKLPQRPTARGRELFHALGYRFHAVVTTLTTPPKDVWRTHNSLADTENRLRGLARCFGADGFCPRSFWATEAALPTAFLLYDLVEPSRARSLLLGAGPSVPSGSECSPAAPSSAAWVARRYSGCPGHPLGSSGP
jgi:hypothetical protein